MHRFLRCRGTLRCACSHTIQFVLFVFTHPITGQITARILCNKGINFYLPWTEYVLHTLRGRLSRTPLSHKAIWVICFYTPVARRITALPHMKISFPPRVRHALLSPLRRHITLCTLAHNAMNVCARKFCALLTLCQIFIVRNRICA